MKYNTIENITGAVKILDWLLSRLSLRERRVIKYRLGFNLRRPLTLEEVGKKIGVTRERVRQIEAKGLERMRNELEDD